jgi:hypothetical protein
MHDHTLAFAAATRLLDTCTTHDCDSTIDAAARSLSDLLQVAQQTALREVGEAETLSPTHDLGTHRGYTPSKLKRDYRQHR